LARTANLQLRASAIIRDELSQPRRRRLPLKGTWGKIKTGVFWGSRGISAFRAYRQMLETVFQRTLRREEKRGRDWAENIETHRPVNLKTRGDYILPSFISVCCYDTSSFAISWAIVVALFIAAAWIETSRSPPLFLKAVTDNRNGKREGSLLIVFVIRIFIHLSPRLALEGRHAATTS